MTAKTSEVEQALRDLVAMSYSTVVDDLGYLVTSKDCTTKFMVESADNKGDKRAMVIYQETPPSPVDYFSLNPFAEGNASNSPSTNFFYKIQRTAMFMRFVRAIGLTVRFIQLQKKIEFNDPRYAIDGTPKCLLDAAAGVDAKNKPIADLVDGKTYDNIMSYFNTPASARDFVYIGYDKRQLRATLRIPIITSEKFGDGDTDIGKMRKSDITVLRGITMAILGIKRPSDLEEFTAVSDNPKAPPKMDSWFTVLFKVYRLLNPYLAIIADIEDDEQMVVDLSVFQKHLNDLAEYANNAKWQIQSNLESVGSDRARGEVAPRMTARDDRDNRSVPRVRPIDDRDDRDRDRYDRDRRDRRDDDVDVRTTRSGVPVMVDERDRRDRDRYDRDRYDRDRYDDRYDDRYRRDDRYRGYDRDRGYDDRGYDDRRDYRRQHRPDPYMPTLSTRRMR